MVQARHSNGRSVCTHQNLRDIAKIKRVTSKNEIAEMRKDNIENFMHRECCNEKYGSSTTVVPLH